MPAAARRHYRESRAWRASGGLAPWPVRVSVICLALFYFLARGFAVDRARTIPRSSTREVPDCPPMRLHLSPPSEWSTGCSSAIRCGWPTRSRASLRDDRGRKIYVHLFDRGHLFTTDPGTPWFMMGSDGARPRSVLAHRLRLARQHEYRTGRRADQLLAGHLGRRVLGLRRRHRRQSDHAMVGNRDVVAIVLFSAGAGRGHSAGIEHGRKPSS